MHHLSHQTCSEILLTYVLITYLLIPWSRVLLEKLSGFQLVKNFPTFHGTRRFTTAFTSARHLSLYLFHLREDNITQDLKKTGCQYKHSSH